MGMAFSMPTWWNQQVFDYTKVTSSAGGNRAEANPQHFGTNAGLSAVRTIQRLPTLDRAWRDSLGEIQPGALEVPEIAQFPAKLDAEETEAHVPNLPEVRGGLSMDSPADDLNL
jgi:hypothetical protein